MWIICQLLMSSALQLDPSLQTKKKAFQAQYEDFVNAQGTLDISNVLTHISDQYQKHTGGPAFTEEQLSSVETVAKEFLLELHKNPSDPTLLQHAAVRLSTKDVDVAPIDDWVLRFYLRVIFLKPAEAKAFDKRYSADFPADLAYQAGLRPHLLAQVAKEEVTAFWYVGICVGKEPVDRLLADLRTAAKEQSQRGSKRKVDHLYSVLEKMGIKPKTGEQRALQCSRAMTHNGPSQFSISSLSTSTWLPWQRQEKQGPQRSSVTSIAAGPSNY